MAQQYEQKVYDPADPSLIKVTFIPSNKPGKSLGFGSIQTNGVSFFYNVYPTDKSPLGIFLGLPSKLKADGTYDNTVIILGFDNRAIYEDLVLQEMAKQGVKVNPGQASAQPYGNSQQANKPKVSLPVDDDLPF